MTPASAAMYRDESEESSRSDEGDRSRSLGPDYKKKRRSEGKEG
jgi:hypothetical protein